MVAHLEVWMSRKHGVGARVSRMFPLANVATLAPEQGAQDGPQSEDCLVLNVWAPKETDAPLPVMVWIHGGGFFNGSASLPTYDGTRFAKHGVVLVSLNYRLNVFGFFSHPALSAESPHGASGNYGVSGRRG